LSERFVFSIFLLKLLAHWANANQFLTPEARLNALVQELNSEVWGDGALGLPIGNFQSDPTLELVRIGEFQAKNIKKPVTLCENW